MDKDRFDFSFSGLKTSVLNYVRSRNPALISGEEISDEICDIGASFQEAVVDVLIFKALRACNNEGIKQLVVVGGVACNSRLRDKLKIEAKKEDILEIDYLGHLFHKEIQDNSPLNKLKSKRYAKPKRMKSSPFYEYFLKNAKIFVAIENDEIVGFVSGRILNQKGKTIEKYGKLEDLFILKKSRRSCFASKLVDSLLKWFKKNKCKHVVLFASPDKPIQKYYGKIGFDIVYYYMCKKL